MATMSRLMRKRTTSEHDVRIPEPPHKKSSSLAPFLQHLWEMVNLPDTNAYIEFTEDGSEFIVHDPDAFSEHVLPQYFKHNKFSSFLRQLNFYGFRKTSKGNEWSWKHECFQKGRPLLLTQIKRKGHNHENAGNRAGFHLISDHAASEVHSELERRIAELESHVLELEISKNQMAKEFRIGRMAQDRMKQEIETLQRQLTAVMAFFFTRNAKDAPPPAPGDQHQLLLSDSAHMPPSDEKEMDPEVYSPSDVFDDLVQPIQNVSLGDAPEDYFIEEQPSHIQMPSTPGADAHSENPFPDTPFL